MFLYQVQKLLLLQLLITPLNRNANRHAVIMLGVNVSYDVSLNGAYAWRNKMLFFIHIFRLELYCLRFGFGLIFLYG